MYSIDYSNLGSTSTAFYKINNQLIQKELTVTHQSKQIEKLKTELMKMYEENENLKIFRKNCISLEEQLKILEEDIKKLNKEKIFIIKKRDENQSLLKRKIDELENLLETQKIENNKKMMIYNQKVSRFNHIIMENEIFSEEVKKLKNDLNNFEENKKEELEKQRMESLRKYEKLKKKMLDTIKQSNEEASKLNMEYMDVNNKLSILQNQQLGLHIKYQKERIKELEKTNIELTKKIKEYENDINMHKLVEKDLTLKNKETNNNEENKEEKTKYRTFYFKKKRKIDSKISALKKINVDNEKDFLKNKNICRKMIRSSSTTNFISKPSIIERRLLSCQQEIKDKQIENENIILANSKLKNRLYLYYNKFKGLFFFLEECLHNFFKDEELSKKKHFLLKMDDIKKMKFDDFNNEEKYAILVLLMKHLLPLVYINFNYKDNIGKELFKTNLNIVNKNYSMIKNYLQDKTLKNAFMDNNNKYHNDLHVYKTSYINNSIPVLRQLQDIELDFYDIRNKAIFY